MTRLVFNRRFGGISIKKARFFKNYAIMAECLPLVGRGRCGGVPRRWGYGENAKRLSLGGRLSPSL
jgi:hypothetical protein